jgi:hypothetical protein
MIGAYGALIRRTHRAASRAAAPAGEYPMALAVDARGGQAPVMPEAIALA